MPEPMPEPNAVAETTDERLRRLEFMVASLHPGLAPDGYAPALPAQSQAGVIPLSLLVNAALPEEGRRRFLHDLPVLRELRLIAQMYLDPRYRHQDHGRRLYPGRRQTWRRRLRRRKRRNRCCGQLLLSRRPRRGQRRQSVCR